MSVYPEITSALLADPNADDCAAYDAAKGNEDAQIWLARLFAAKSEAATDRAFQASGALIALVYSGLAAVHGKVEAVSLYRDCLARHRALAEYHPSSAALQDERIARLGAAVEGKAPTDRVEVRI